MIFGENAGGEGWELARIMQQYEVVPIWHLD